MPSKCDEKNRPSARHAFTSLAAVVVAGATLVLVWPAQTGATISAPYEPQAGTNSSAVPEKEWGNLEGSTETPTITLADGTEVVASDLIVNYEAGATAAQRNLARDTADSTLGEHYPDVGTEVVELGAPARSAGELTAKKAHLEASPGVESVEYDEVSRLAAETGWPNDPLFRRGKQGNLRAVGAPRAWSKSRGGVRVAVLDTGCSGAHVELDRGKIVDQHDFFYGDDVADDRIGHGTHVSSILAANTNNGRGMAGGAPGAQIVCVKVTSDLGSWTTRVLLAGLHFAGNRGARVINMSLAGGRSPHRSLTRRIKALSDDGVFLVAAAGNECKTKKADYPASYPGVMAVGATERDGTGRYRTPYGCSNAGPYLDIAAPGESIWGADVRRRDSYTTKTGTSMAAPHVAAAGALLAARGARAQGITAALRRSADDRGPRGEDAVYGAGLADFDGALTYYANHR